MPPLDRSDSTRKYWRSLNELEQTPEFQHLVENEFPGGPEEEWTESSRRRFLQLMGASLALGTASSCRWQKEYIAPMAERPEGWVPGKPRHYSSMMQLGGVAQPVTVTSYDGRPTKVEGNAEHPASLGATGNYVQAATLELCDPDRSHSPARGMASGEEHNASWSEFETWLADHLRGSLGNGAGLAVLAPQDSSPAFAALRDRFAQTFPQARFVTWEAWSRIAEQEGLSSVLGAPARPVYDLASADIVLTLDEDLLGQHPDQVRHSKEFATRRLPEERTMNRLYSVEPSFTLTGAAADHRLPVRGSQVALILSAIMKDLADNHGIGMAPTNATGALLGQENVSKFVHAVAGDLAAHRGRCVVAAGPTQPADVHAAVAALNQALGNRGKTVEYIDASSVPAANPADVASLVGAMNGGEISTLVCLGTNPVYDAPADLGFGEALAKVANKIHFGLYRDETAVQCDWHLNAAHWLESWGDALSWDGTYTLAQPLIAPLYGGKDAYAFLGMLIGRGEVEAQSWVKQIFGRTFGPEELTWRKAVQRGFQPGSSFRAAGAVNAAPAPQIAADAGATWQEGQPLEANFRADLTLYDGRYANLGWLQELPDPLTKLTWDNAAVMGVATAEALGVKDHDLVEFELDGRTLELAVYIMPGQAPGTVQLPLGYGRTECGHVAGLPADEIEPVGFNTYALRTSGALAYANGLTMNRKSGRYQLASTQDHHVIDAIGQSGRDQRLGELVRGGTLEDWREHPDFAQHVVHHPPLKSLWKEHEYEGYRWAMSIDLSSCTGCSACTIACQAENNIPIVGKKQVFMGREMAWIRMDRYFTGEVENPQVEQQPVGCQHCENAPCEQVCPVAATVHSSEGLNDMVYNRCIGTRYCSNNCPYKVRRFNFLHWNKDLNEDGNEVRHVSMNPEVTVRSRGVMEKCSYCVQRIATARVERHTKGEQIQDGDIVTACQQVCPSDAIHFGNLNEEASVVRQKHENDRAYAMLPELNNKPRTAYLATIRNPHPDLAPAHTAGGHGGHDDGHADDGHGNSAEKEEQHG